jgi:amino acid transporter
VLAIALSGYFTGVLVFGSSAERTMFSLARDGLLPGYLCRVHERYGSPSSACVTTFAVAVVVSLLTEATMVELYGVVRGLLYGILFWITVMSVLNLAYHVAVNVSLSRVAVRERLRGLVTVLSHHLLPAAGTAISLVIIYFSLAGLNVPVLYAVPTMAAYLAAVIALAVRRLRG